MRYQVRMETVCILLGLFTFARPVTVGAPSSVSNDTTSLAISINPNEALPPEILVYILQHLEGKDLLCADNACHTWRSIHQDDHVLRSDLQAFRLAMPVIRKINKLTKTLDKLNRDTCPSDKNTSFEDMLFKIQNDLLKVLHDFIRPNPSLLSSNDILCRKNALKYLAEPLNRYYGVLLEKVSRDRGQRIEKCIKQSLDDPLVCASNILCFLEIPSRVRLCFESARFAKSSTGLESKLGEKVLNTLTEYGVEDMGVCLSLAEMYGFHFLATGVYVDYLKPIIVQIIRSSSSIFPTINAFLGALDKERRDLFWDEFVRAYMFESDPHYSTDNSILHSVVQFISMMEDEESKAIAYRLAIQFMFHRDIATSEMVAFIENEISKLENDSYKENLYNDLKQWCECCQLNGASVEDEVVDVSVSNQFTYPQNLSRFLNEKEQQGYVDTLLSDIEEGRVSISQAIGDITSLVDRSQIDSFLYKLTEAYAKRADMSILMLERLNELISSIQEDEVKAQAYENMVVFLLESRHLTEDHVWLALDGITRIQDERLQVPLYRKFHYWFCARSTIFPGCFIQAVCNIRKTDLFIDITNFILCTAQGSLLSEECRAFIRDRMQIVPNSRRKNFLLDKLHIYAYGQ